ncbi:MAG: MFS transporter, partial [Mesorhizobium sp.]
ANASGFSEGLNRDAAANVAGWLFLAFVPLGTLGCLAAIRIAMPTAHPQEATG